MCINQSKRPSHGKNRWLLFRVEKKKIANQATVNQTHSQSHKCIQKLESWFRERGDTSPFAPAKPSFTIITQAIDCLHQRSGAQNVLELYGNVFEHTCLTCGQRLEPSKVKSSGGHCSLKACGFVRPNTVLIGQIVDREKWIDANMRIDLLGKNDVCIFIGSHANEYPWGYLPELAIAKGASLIEINPMPSRIIEEYKQNEDIIFCQGSIAELIHRLQEKVCPTSEEKKSR